MKSESMPFNAQWAASCLRGDPDALQAFIEAHLHRLQTLTEDCRSRWEQIRLSTTDFARVVAQIIAKRFSTLPPGEHATPLDLLESLVLDDLFLATACAQGDNAAWGIFQQEYQPFIYQVALKYLKNSEKAHDLADSLLADLYIPVSEADDSSSKIASYNGLGSLKGWLRIIVYRKVVDRHRQLSRANEVPFSPVEGDDDDHPPNLESRLADEQTGSPEEQYQQKKYREIFRAVVPKAFQQLNAKEKNLVDYYYFKGLKEKTIGEMYHVHESTASRWLAKIRQKLRTAIEREMLGTFGLSKEETFEYFSLVMKDLDLNLKGTIRAD